jgi:hypothetical protein
LFDLWLKSVKKPTRIELTLSPIRRDKTTQQLRYYYGVLIPALCEETGYVPVEADGILKKFFLTVNKGTPKEYIKSKADLTVEEMSQYLDNCVTLCYEQGIYVPEVAAELKG